ncbi:FadR/GntR family transcriptional regulator [Pseudonocardia sp.]|uniref:FadR/GntR family transcriptional regulator n=1 Tax=Pseudonocardia sp. TaxID=60912 RepID=UPI003D0B6261
MSTGETARTSRAEHIASAIERRIADEQLASGHRLGTKQTLCQEYDAAPATLTEAIRLLSARGTVTMRPGPNGGVFVASPTALVRLGRKMLELSGDSVTVADCLTVRDQLDPLVILEATRYRNSRDVEELRELARAMAAEDLAWGKYLRINWALHRRMVEITPNQVLRHTYLSMLEYVESRLQGVTPIEPGPEVSTRLGAQVHVELVDAIASEDLGRATAAAAAHTQLTANRGATS